MAVVTVTPIDVRPLPGALVQRFQAAVILAPGDAVTLDTNGQLILADADAFATVRAIGVVCSVPNGGVACVAGDWVDVVTHGPVTGFTSLNETLQLHISTTAGDIDDVAPAPASGDFIWVIGYPISPVSMFVRPYTWDIAAQ